MSFSWTTSGGSGWLWWRDTDFLDGGNNKSSNDEKRVYYVYIFTLSPSAAFHWLTGPEHTALHPPGVSLLVVSIECRHVALEVLLQLVEGAHRLIKCPGKQQPHVSGATTGMLADGLHSLDSGLTG